MSVQFVFAILNLFTCLCNNNTERAAELPLFYAVSLKKRIFGFFTSGCACGPEAAARDRFEANVAYCQLVEAAPALTRDHK